VSLDSESICNFRTAPYQINNSVAIDSRFSGGVESPAMIGGGQMTAVSNKTDGTTLLVTTPYEDSTDDQISKQAREETIRLRAYDLYLNRGGEDGSDVDDWLRAEIECFGSV
jgi:hypothetical protein